MKQVTKAMIMAAGFGTRLKPFTDKHPKALVQINGKSLLQRNIEYLQQNGIKDVVVNAHHFADQIEEAIATNKGWGSNVTLSFEQYILETGGGLQHAEHYLKEEPHFILMNADVLTNMPLQKMIQQHAQYHPLATLATCNRKTSRYLLFNNNDLLCGWRNVNTGEVKIADSAEHYTEKAFSGIHVISHKIFEKMQSFSGKFSIVDVYLQLAQSEAIQAFQHDEHLFVDVGKPGSIIIAEGMFR